LKTQILTKIAHFNEIRDLLQNRPDEVHFSRSSCQLHRQYGDGLGFGRGFQIIGGRSVSYSARFKYIPTMAFNLLRRAIVGGVAGACIVRKRVDEKRRTGLSFSLCPSLPRQVEDGRPDAQKDPPWRVAAPRRESLHSIYRDTLR
jgi:hypothetical protein